MAPRAEGSHLKRNRDAGSPPEEQESAKKLRRSARQSQQRADHDKQKTPIQNQHHLPSPVTHLTSESTTEYDKEATATPPHDRPNQVARRRGDDSQGLGFSSPPQDTQAFSQQDIDPNAPLVEGVDEMKEGVWGYLLPLDTRYVKAPVVLKRKGACPPPAASVTAPAKKGGRRGQKPAAKDQDSKAGPASGGYIIGRHPECDIRVDDPQVSNRHCLIFTENKGDDVIAVVEDLSTNGTFVNSAYLKRNERRELQEGDEVAVTQFSPGFIFRYPRYRQGRSFAQQYTMMRRLGSGHFAQVYMCAERSTGDCYAVKKFTKAPGVDERSKYEGLHQEVAMLMGISHPNILCLRETFNEPEAVYVVLELAPNGELFNLIVQLQKLTEDQTRRVFVQLFEGIKYLHDRNMVHRDLKPENILLMDEDFTVKIGDFGLAKIVGEASFTTTLCGTPSYVAPEVLADSRNRKYTKAVDIWSLGVVLYICLCGFPPFSDELRTADFPYSLADQIRKGIFDYPSPYWDSVGDPALDLIDRMLVVDPERRYTVDECLAHPWLTQKPPGVNDSTNGLVSGIAGLEMSRRGPVRERTLLASVNTVHVTERVPAGAGKPDVKVYSKNPVGKTGSGMPPPNKKEMRPDENRDPAEFMEMGGKGDQVLFDESGEDSRYPNQDIVVKAKEVVNDDDEEEEQEDEANGQEAGKQKGKGKGKGKGAC
ncbi:kinase-like domain-containing protein [Achaetomium macrosporum]|uniref:Kinase-like domain-containing protein n=1 Tax=Achaetomium macrosporum TaxID=79813 RepID=A0AAN7CFP6_9PEZI|nr:kinase-like domain-containing protein [Achaetomium macrosporum]